MARSGAVSRTAGGSFSFTVNSPTLWTSSLTGNVAQMPDPSGFMYASLGYSLRSESTCTFPETSASCGPAHEAIDELSNFGTQAHHRR